MAKYKIRHIGWFFGFIWNCIRDLCSDPRGYFECKIGTENWQDFKTRIYFDTDPEAIELTNNLARQLEEINDKSMNREEYILCAANYYNDGIVHEHQPKNIEIGFVICGRRHHNCIMTFAIMMGFPYDEKAHKIMATEIQGFLTNTDKFVTREEAATIAILANQVQDETLIKLFSEDLY